MIIVSFCMFYRLSYYYVAIQDGRHSSCKIRFWSQQWNQLADFNDIGVLLTFLAAGIISHGFVNI